MSLNNTGYDIISLYITKEYPLYIFCGIDIKFFSEELKVKSVGIHDY